MADVKQDILAGWSFDPARYAGATAGPWEWEHDVKQHRWVLRDARHVWGELPLTTANKYLQEDAPRLAALCERQAGEIAELRADLDSSRETGFSISAEYIHLEEQKAAELSLCDEEIARLRGALEYCAGHARMAVTLSNDHGRIASLDNIVKRALRDLAGGETGG